MTGRRGPRPAGSDTREAILEAARSTFAEAGYDRATVRAIAARAGVDPALVHHYFGTKEGLFAAAVHLPVSPGDALAEVFAGDRAGAGERLATLFLRVWEDPTTRNALLGQLRSAMATGAPPPMRDFVVSSLFRPAATHLTGPDPELRMELAAAHLMGIALLRHVLRVEPLASEPLERLVAAVAPRLQAYLDAG